MTRERPGKVYGVEMFYILIWCVITCCILSYITKFKKNIIHFFWILWFFCFFYFNNLFLLCLTQKTLICFSQIYICYFSYNSYLFNGTHFCWFLRRNDLKLSASLCVRVPKTTHRRHHLPERHRGFRKVITFMVMVYYNKMI